MNIKLFISILVVLLSLFIFSLVAFWFKEEIYFKSLIHDTTALTRLIDKNTDHNQALDVASYAEENGVKIPSVLINFDTHSDMYINHKTNVFDRAGIDNWINIFLVRYPEVDEIYWVLPDELANDLSMRKIFAYDDIPDLENNIDFCLFGNLLDTNLGWEYFVKTPLVNNVYEQDFYLDIDNSNILEIKNDYHLRFLKKGFVNKRKFKLINCTAKTLPDFKGKDVFLSIDADYISNSGNDTLEHFAFNKNSYEVRKSFISIFETIKNKNIHPVIISMTLSPEYLPQKYHKLVNKIFEDIIKYSGKQDCLSNYLNSYMFHYDVKAN